MVNASNTPGVPQVARSAPTQGEVVRSTESWLLVSGEPLSYDEYVSRAIRVALAARGLRGKDACSALDRDTRELSKFLRGVRSWSTPKGQALLLALRAWLGFDSCRECHECGWWGASELLGPLYNE